MVQFTLPSGIVVHRPATDFVRCRPSISSDNNGHIGTTLFKPKFIVMEPVDQVGPALWAELASFVYLNGVKDRDLWFDAAKAKDAETPRASEAVNGVRAVIRIGGIRMRVLDTVTQAQSVIDTGRAAAPTN